MKRNVGTAERVSPIVVGVLILSLTIVGPQT